MNQKNVAVVLLSGGQDSTTCFHYALKDFDEVHAVSFNYGQRHAVELEAGKAIVEMARETHPDKMKTHVTLDATVLSQIGDSALVDKEADLAGSGGRPDSEMPEGLPTSFVPGRNVLFLTLAAAYAVKVGADRVVTGVCQTDYSGYPDCRDVFVRALEKAIKHGFPSSCNIVIDTPLMFLSKRQTVELAVKLGPHCMAALAKSVTCYNGEVPGCGKCPACELRAKGFEEAGISDPQYGEHGDTA